MEKTTKIQKQLGDLTREEFNVLKGMGLLWELYPDAPEFYDEIEKNRHVKISLMDNDETRRILENYKRKGIWPTDKELRHALENLYNVLVLKKLKLHHVICPWMADEDEIKININLTIPVVIRKKHKK